MRVKLSKESRDLLFGSLKRRAINISATATQLNVSPRTVRDWRRGKFLMQQDAFKKLIALSALSAEILAPEIVPDFWNAHSSGRMGGFARLKLYGPPGTPEGRRKGWLAAIATHRGNGNSRFTTLKKINEPEYSEQLAEFMGIMMGDGHLAERQASMTTNSETDIQHAKFVAGLIEDLFGISATLRFKKGQRAVDVIASSTALVNYLRALGMPQGNKIAGGISMPIWILENESYQKAFLRGLFDTDGCIYLDRHLIKGEVYRNLGWTITSYADKLRADVHETLVSFGFSPTCRAPYTSVFLRRKNDIGRYFSEIGTHNEKHLIRYQSFLNLREASHSPV